MKLSAQGLEVAAQRLGAQPIDRNHPDCFSFWVGLRLIFLDTRLRRQPGIVTDILRTATARKQETQREGDQAHLIRLREAR